MPEFDGPPDGPLPAPQPVPLPAACAGARSARDPRVDSINCGVVACSPAFKEGRENFPAPLNRENLNKWWHAPGADEGD